MSINKLRKELSKRLKAMEQERDALSNLEDDVSEQRWRMQEACNSIREAIERLSEVV